MENKVKVSERRERRRNSVQKMPLMKKKKKKDLMSLTVLWKISRSEKSLSRR